MDLWTPLSFVWIGGGVVAGVASGLLGIGGGLLMVPLLFWTFSYTPLPPEWRMHIAIASSLSVIVLTSFSGSIAHLWHRSLKLSIVALMGIGGIVGGLTGSLFAVHLSGRVLQQLFGLIEIWVGLRWIFEKPIFPYLKPVRIHATSTFLIGLVAGVFSALFGVGGGLIAVPLMVSVLGMPIHHAVGTSMGLVFINASAGVIGYLSFDRAVVDAAEGFGYLYLPAIVWLAVGSLPSAPIGAALANRLRAERLKRVFSCCLMGIGIVLLMVPFFAS